MKKIAIDFAGVLSRNGVPVDGAKESLDKLTQEYLVIIFTTENTKMVEDWLNQWGFPSYTVTNEKPVAIAYIDDRAIRFTNWYDIQKYFI